MEKERLNKATQTLKDYQAGKESINTRIKKNEEYYNIRGWSYINDQNYQKDSFKVQSGWLFNSIANKHADFMDNFPMPNILPRERNDKEEAERLTSIIPCILKNNHFKRTYSEVALEKLKNGTGVYGIFWDSTRDNGLGDITIKAIDIFNLAWEPNIKDIQESRNLFYYRPIDTDLLKQMYPKLKDFKGSSIDIPEYVNAYTADKTNKSVVIDWYYKKNGKVHLCKYVGEHTLYCSEEDPEAKDVGIYEHGMYPFVFDKLYKINNSPCGFGQIDVMRNPQDWIDILNQQVMVNAKHCSRPRYFVKTNGSINIDEFADTSKDLVSVSGNDLGMDSIRRIDVPVMPSYVIEALDRKVDELKETSGNRDWSQGGTASGVTAASAIAALQEAGSKLSRDMIGDSYTSFEMVVEMVIELIRQFYDDERTFRITGKNGGEDFVTYDNRSLKLQPETIHGATFYRKPVFDLDIVASKSSVFTRVANNEFAKELFAMGLFNPSIADQALVVMDMMQFEGKEVIMGKVAKNAMLPKLIQDVMALAMAVEQLTGRTDILPELVNRYGLSDDIGAITPNQDYKSYNPVSDNVNNRYEGGIVNKAKQNSANASAVK